MSSWTYDCDQLIKIIHISLPFFLRNNISFAYLWVQIQFHTTYLKCEFHPNYCLQPLTNIMLLFMDYWPLLLVMEIFVYGSLTMVLLFSWTIGHCCCSWTLLFISYWPCYYYSLWILGHYCYSWILLFMGHWPCYYYSLWTIGHCCYSWTCFGLHKKSSSIKESKKNAT